MRLFDGRDVPHVPFKPVEECCAGKIGGANVSSVKTRLGARRARLSREVACDPSRSRPELVLPVRQGDPAPVGLSRRCTSWLERGARVHGGSVPRCSLREPESLPTSGRHRGLDHLGRSNLSADFGSDPRLVSRVDQARSEREELRVGPGSPAAPGSPAEAIPSNRWIPCLGSPARSGARSVTSDKHSRTSSQILAWAAGSWRRAASAARRGSRRSWMSASALSSASISSRSTSSPLSARSSPASLREMTASYRPRISFAHGVRLTIGTRPFCRASRGGRFALIEALRSSTAPVLSSRPTSCTSHRSRSPLRREPYFRSGACRDRPSLAC